jgi:hypothetical protein
MKSLDEFRVKVRDAVWEKDTGKDLDVDLIEAGVIKTHDTLVWKR